LQQTAAPTVGCRALRCAGAAAAELGVRQGRGEDGAGRRSGGRTGGDRPRSGRDAEWIPGKPPKGLGQKKAGIPTGTWQRGLVRVRGAHVQCFLNDQKQFDATLEGSAAGCVGLRTCLSTFRFRNIKVTDPDGKVLLEGLPDLSFPTKD
jgi:hypothetical protein